VHRSGADSPLGINHGQSDGARVPPRWSSHRGRLVAPDESARSREATPSWAVARRSHSVSTLHFARPAACIPGTAHEKGYRGPIVNGVFIGGPVLGSDAGKIRGEGILALNMVLVINSHLISRVLSTAAKI
jgi:hypothetical protein